MKYLSIEVWKYFKTLEKYIRLLGLEALVEHFIEKEWPT